MRFPTILPLLAATALASSSSSASDSDSSSSSSASPTPEEPTPAGEIWTAKWTDSDLSPYQKLCASSTTFKASIYTLGEMYPTLKEWAPQLKVFYNKQLYPGSWEGKDVHGEGRELLKMPYEELPFAVREWLHKTPKQRHFSVQDDVVFFAPGAIYPILPLFVDEPASTSLSDCEGLYEDLENYSATPKEGVVLGKVERKSLGKNAVEVTVEAFQVKGKAEGKDEL
ncbi:hypothetical protein BU23DRAFT_537450 [Bimuria novae-zelandiae CBS 107.79]|uniref:Uncharacterized protein n=1 Tax=Bimuria novae-zelandiae CBS 107.79 TaxID=1447943 RepID=A0A6A5V1H7_9PLEO|nr:hypothetical protein BU23DRAFT_537450 [Bimuria novae-zelandiae CBS 107.79]